jgi:hypothetical protein
MPRLATIRPGDLSRGPQQYGHADAGALDRPGQRDEATGERPAPATRSPTQAQAQAPAVASRDAWRHSGSRRVRQCGRGRHDGSRAAFIAQNNTTQAWALFTMDGAGKSTPQQVNASLPGCPATCGDVLAYNP